MPDDQAVQHVHVRHDAMEPGDAGGYLVFHLPITEVISTLEFVTDDGPQVVGRHHIMIMKGPRCDSRDDDHWIG